MREDFLQFFFGDGNGIKWEQYQSATPAAPLRILLEPWVHRVQQQKTPILLPRVDPAAGRTAWYVLCADAREARSMRESLMAFVGPTYTAFSGEFATLDPADPVERLCRDQFGGLVFRLVVKNRDDRTEVGKLLNKLIEFRERQSTRSLANVRPIGRLLRDLEMAILTNNEPSAWTVYSEIRNRGRLSATNLAFLQIRIYSAFEHWGEMLLLPNLNDLLQVRRPKQISEQIARAVYQQYFLKHESVVDVRGAIDDYRTIGTRFQNLIRSTEELRSPDAIKFALIGAISADPPKQEVAEQLCKNPAISIDSGWVKTLLAMLSSQAGAHSVADATTDSVDADAKYNENSFDEALTLYLAQPHTQLSVCRVLEIAVEVDTISAAEAALKYLTAAPDQIRGRVFGRRVCLKHIEFLTRICAHDSAGNVKAIASLSDWFEYVDESESPEAAGELLEHGIKHWVTNSTFDALDIARKLQKGRTGRKAELIRNAVPTFIRALLIDDTPKRECKPIYASLAELLIYDDATGPDDLAAIEQLIEIILTTAPSHVADQNDLEFAAEVTVDLWHSIAAPRHFDWVLSMLDLLIDTGAQHRINLAPVLASIINSSRSWTHRISDEQWSLLRLLAADLNLSEMVAEFFAKAGQGTKNSRPEFSRSLSGKSVAIYSLTERFAKRAQQLIQSTFEGVIVHLLHDQVCTDRMKSLAKSVDIFIINTLDAKHAVANGIRENRPDGKRTIQPKGKSSTAVFRALTELRIQDVS
jgi:hypothetical protein